MDPTLPWGTGTPANPLPLVPYRLLHSDDVLLSPLILSTAQLNALNSELFHELNDAMEACDKDEGIGAIVLTGSEKAFAAGADIKEMKDKEFAEVYKTKFLGHWTKMNSIRKPIIGAVSGYAVGRERQRHR